MYLSGMNPILYTPFGSITVNELDPVKHKTVSPYSLYVREVVKLTNQNPLIKALPNYSRRGVAKRKGYAIDHIIPLSYGFANSIDPDIMSHILNLQCITWQANTQKGCKVPDNVSELLTRVRIAIRQEHIEAIAKRM